MSFNYYTNVAAGSFFGTVFTDDVALLDAADMSLTGQIIYLNGKPMGKIISNYFLPGDNPSYGHTLNKFKQDGSPDAGYDATGLDLMGITFESKLYTEEVFTAISLNAFIYAFSNDMTLLREGIQPSNIIGAKHYLVFTDDEDFIIKAKNSLVGQTLVINGQPFGTISANYLFDGNSAGYTAELKVFSDLGIEIYSVPVKGKVLQAFYVDEANFTLDPNIGISKLSIAPSANYYFTNKINIDRHLAYATQFSMLYCSRYLGQAEKLRAGNLACYINGKYFAPVFDYEAGAWYGNSIPGGDKLPHSSDTGAPFADNTPLFNYYIAGKPVFNEQINKVEFKPYYWRKMVTDKGTTYRAYGTGGTVKKAVKPASIGKNLYVDRVCVGVITNVGVEDLYIDGLGPVNFVNATGNWSAPVLSQYFIEVGAPTVLPAIKGDSRISVGVSNGGYAELIEGVLYLYNQANPTAEDPNTLIGKRLLVNNIYIGKIEKADANSITVLESTLGDMASINGVWQVEITDVAGRYPLICGAQMELVDWPWYPILNAEKLDYNVSYDLPESDPAFPDPWFPSGTAAFAKRDDTHISNQYTDRIHYHEYPAWMEQAVIDIETKTYFITGDETEDIDIPYRAFYTYSLSALNASAQLALGETDMAQSEMFRKMWQMGKYVEIFKAGTVAAGNSPWYPTDLINAHQAHNIPCFLEDASANENPSNIIDRIHVASPNRVVYYGEFKSDVFYKLNSVVTFENEFYLKTTDLGETFRGYKSATRVYATGDIVLNKDHTLGDSYQRFNGTSFETYTNPNTPDVDWQLLTQRGYYV